MASDKRPVFGIFEGGGAKGIAHIGALEAVELNGLEFIGVAGASAGAIVATLIAAGLKAADIMNPSKLGSDILSSRGVSPIQILGETRWRRFTRFRNGAVRLSCAVGFGGLLFGLVAAPRTSLAAWQIWRRRGYFSTERFREFVNDVLYERLRMLHEEKGADFSNVSRRIRFVDLTECVLSLSALRIEFGPQ